MRLCLVDGGLWIEPNNMKDKQTGDIVQTVLLSPLNYPKNHTVVQRNRPKQDFSTHHVKVF